MRELPADTRVFEKACDFAEEVMNNGRSFEDMIRAIKRAWVYMHDEKAYYARKDAQRTIQP